MIEQEDLLQFDRFQQLVTWLNINMIRKGRRFLDTNKMLLHAEADREIERLIKARVEEILGNMQKMHHHRILLRDVRRRGGTPIAIQEAYVNMYGGIAALDLPPWLETIERRRLFLSQLRHPERTTRAQIKLLSDALFRATHDVNVAPEILAELQCELGDLLVHSPHSHTFVDHLETLRRAITCYNEALSIYTLERYPRQYAKVYLCLGEVSLQYGLATGEEGMIERAIDCYKTAALVFHSPDEFPEQWTVLYTSLGNAYAQRRLGDHEENMTKAITCHQSALQSVSLTNFPILWAKIQINLGDLSQQNTIGERLTNLKRAKTYYETVQQVYSEADSPDEENEDFATSDQPFPKEDIHLLEQRLREGNTIDVPDTLSSKINNRLQHLRGKNTSTLPSGIPLELLQRLLSDERWQLRQWVIVHVVERLKENTPIEFIITALNDTHGAVRLSALQSCKLLGIKGLAFIIYKIDIALHRHQVIKPAASHALTILNKQVIDMGDPEENTADASCYQSSLDIAAFANLPTLQAKIQTNLGDLYQQNTLGERLTNLKRARTYYEAALQVYERAAFPKEWADLQARLAVVFQSIAQEDTKKQDLYQGCALVCYECTLGVYTEDAFPVEYAATLVSLGNLYRNRMGGERSANLAQALRCYRNALQVFTHRRFPFQHSQVCRAIAETETLSSKEAL